MTLRPRLALAPVLAVAAAILTIPSAQATSGPLSAGAVAELAAASCQLDPAAPLSIEELAPVVIGEADVDVVPGEITAHVVRAQVNTVAGDVQQCTFGVLHRDALLPQVKYDGTASLALVDTATVTSFGAETEVDLGNMGHQSPVDPTTEVSLGGFLTPLESASEDPTYAVTLRRLSIEVVQIAVTRAQKHAADHLLRAQLKAAAKLEKRSIKAAHGKHADKAVAAAQRAHDRRVAAAQAKYLRATTPKTVARPVGHVFAVSGTVPAST